MARVLRRKTKELKTMADFSPNEPLTRKKSKTLSRKKKKKKRKLTDVSDSNQNHDVPTQKKRKLSMNSNNIESKMDSLFECCKTLQAERDYYKKRMGEYKEKYQNLQARIFDFYAQSVGNGKRMKLKANVSRNQNINGVQIVLINTHSNFANNSLKKRTKHYFYSSRSIGQHAYIKSRHEYPVLFDTTQKVNERLKAEFGQGFSIAMNEKYDNKWSQIAHGMINIVGLPKVVYNLEFGARSIAVNEKSGYIAQISPGKWSIFIHILQSIGTNSYKIVCSMPVKIKEQWKLKTLRIRYVGQNVFIFDSSSLVVYHYMFYEATGSLRFVQKIYEEYFKESQIKDVLATNDLLMILFNRWVGIYKLYPKFEWFHAVSYCQNDDVKASSFEMNIFDHFDRANDDDEKQICEDKKKIVSKESIKNYIFINTDNSVIAVHPINPTFDYLKVAGNVKNGSSYCMSSRYGMFCIGPYSNEILQHPKFDNKKHSVLQLTCDETCNGYYKMEGVKLGSINNIRSFLSVRYDEGFGISGRLLTVCKLDNNKIALHQSFNQDELSPLKQELKRIEYHFIPGTKKPFNLTLFVYEMLYGLEYIEAFLRFDEIISV